MKLKKFLISAIIVCGCGLLANLNNSTLAMMNHPQIPYMADAISVVCDKDDSLEERDPTRPLCNCEKCKQYDRSKVFNKILYETNIKDPMEKIKNLRVTVYPIVNNNVNIEEKVELHDTYIGNTKPPEDDCIILCIPYDLPEGFYHVKVKYNDENGNEICNNYCKVPLKKIQKIKI